MRDDLWILVDNLVNHLRERGMHICTRESIERITLAAWQTIDTSDWDDDDDVDDTSLPAPIDEEDEEQQALIDTLADPFASNAEIAQALEGFVIKLRL